MAEPKKKPAATPPRKPRGVVKNDQRRAPHLMNLINDGFWLLALMLTAYVALTLASFTMDDPAWSRSIEHERAPHNLGGVFGAYLADIGYYIFGLSVWWWLAAAAVWLYHSFRPRTRAEDADNKPYHLGWAAAGLALLLLCSPLLEALLWPQQLNHSLPVGAGGLIGQLLAGSISHILGLSGSLLLILVLMVLGVSLLLQVSWLTLIEKAGAQVEWLWFKLIRQPHRYIRERPQTKASRRMVKQARAITAAEVEPVAGSSSNRKAVPVRTQAEPAVQRDLFDAGADTDAAPTGDNAADSGLIRLPELALLSTPPTTTAEVNPEQLQLTAERNAQIAACLAAGVGAVLWFWFRFGGPRP